MPSSIAQPIRTRRKVVEYDALRRRVWICGQRCHHGAAGSIVALMACAGLLVEPSTTSPTILAIAAGGALMVHDWKDRSIWFQRGHGSQP